MKESKILVCCSTCFNDNCFQHSSFQHECLDENSTRNRLLFWSEETGYLPKLHSYYPYIHWKAKPEFIRKGEMWMP